MVNGTPGWKGYYLSAYGLAVKRGYPGTEEEWLDSLHGADVEMRYENGELQWKHDTSEEWHTLEEFTVLQELLEQRSERAQAAAELAEEKAQTAGTAATAANIAAGAANSAAAAANTAASTVSKAKEEAEAAAEAAEMAAEEANTAAEAATVKAQAADLAASSANTAAAEAQTAKSEASAAAGLANSKASAAETAAGQANTAAGAAQEAKTAANIAAGLANTAAETAQTQGNYAKAQGDRAAQLVDEIEDTDVGGMAADILALQSGKADLVNGKVPDAQLPELDFDPAGSAAAVQETLAAHTGSQANPHSVTAEQAGALPLTGGTLTGPLSIGPNLEMEQEPSFSVEATKEILTVGDNNLAAGIGAAAIGRQNVVCPGKRYDCSSANSNQVELDGLEFGGDVGNKIILVSSNVTTKPQVVEILEMSVYDDYIVLETTPFTGAPAALILPDINSNNKYFYSSCAEGSKNLAIGKYGSHAEGYQTTASAIGSHAEGRLTSANGSCSHAEGLRTQANGTYTHAEGSDTIATGECSHVEGAYNIEDTENQYLHIAGNGSSSARSNAYTLDWDGNGWYAGKVSAGTAENPALPTQANDLATKKYVDDALTQSAPAYLSGTEDLTAGTSPLETGKLYFMYE